MKILIRERISCWYELSFRKEKPAIILRIHRDFIANTEPIRQIAPIVKGFMKHFGFKRFNGSLAGNFGFDDSFVFNGIKGDFAEFAVNIPEVRKHTSKKCEYCNGSGRDRLLRDECFRCDGTGKEWFYDWKSVYAISASFTTIFHRMHFPDKETSSFSPQLMIVSTVTQNDMHGGSLGGQYSIELCDWMRSLYLRNNDRYEITEMVEAMKVAHRKMSGPFRFGQEHYIRARIENSNSWLNIDCPGDACGLHPGDGFGPQEGQGYEFACHNVDNPIQQITLLVGLAALHDKARREMKT